MLSSITRVVTYPDLDAATKTVEFVFAYTKNSDHFMNSVLFKVCLHTIINSIQETLPPFSKNHSIDCFHPPHVVHNSKVTCYESL